MKRFRGLSLGKQIIGYYLILFLITVSICMSLYFYILNTTISDSENNTLEYTLRDIETNFNSVLARSNEYSKIVAFSENVQDVLHNEEGGDKGYQSIDMSSIKLVTGSTVVASVYVFDNYGNMYIAANEYIRTPTSKDITQASWYQEALDAKGGYILKRNAGDFLQGQVMEENYVSLIRIINDLNTLKPIGAIILNISVAEMNKVYQFAQTEYGMNVVITDEYEVPIVEAFGSETRSTDQVLSVLKETDQKHSVFKDNKRSYKLSSLTMKGSDWQIIGLLPRDQNDGEAKFFSRITIVILALIGIFLSVGAVIITRFISEPIRRLLDSMKKVEQKEFVEIEEVPANKEMNQLQTGYNLMIVELNDLFKAVLAEQKKKRKYELDVLHAQIKPHFLYNTFDSVGALALMKRSDDVFIMMQALGSYYRTSLHKGQEVITIDEEFKIVSSYLIIQKYRYEDVFEVSYDVDDHVKQCKTLKLVLQPFVENAIYHGLKTTGSGGNIIVRAHDRDQYVLLQIEDDGAGMSEKRLEEVISGAETEGGRSFGVYGTIERIHLFYESDDLVEIKSKEGKGTIVSVMIPKNIDR